MRRYSIGLIVILTFSLATAPGTWAFFGSKIEQLTPENGNVRIKINDIDDGKAHYFKVKSDSGIMVTFFTLKSRDGIIRAAIDACDVCYRSGRGYVQDGDYMVCTNCGQRFASTRINVIKGGCNPAPLDRKVEGKYLVINMDHINQNSWYCEYKKQ